MDIRKVSSESVASTGDTITYTLTLTVTGSTAYTVHVSDVLPNHLVYVGMGTVPMGGIPNWDPTTKTLTWDWTSLPIGTYTLTYQATVDASVKEGTVLVNNAQLTYSGLSGSKQVSVSVTMATLFMVHVGVYNESGELVKEIWVQELSQEVKDFSLAATNTITSVHGEVYVMWKGQQIAAWDGTNAAGDPVSNGKYYIKVDNTDSLGVVTSVSQDVMVSRSIAKVSVNIYNEAGEIVRHLYSYVDDPSNNILGDIQLSSNVIKPSAVSNSNGTVAITSSSGMTILWDGKSDSGTIVTNGRYQVEIHFVDGKGGEQIITRGLLVQSDNSPISDGNVFAGPNIIKGGLNSTLIQVHSDSNYTLTARLYDTAGELVKAAVSGPAGTNKVSLDLTGIASGLYFAVVDLTTSQGGIVGHQVTQIVIQR